MTIYTDLCSLISPECVLGRPIDRISYASDASFYRLIPQVVVQAKSVDDIRKLFKYSNENKIPITFRAAGTSLSGQSITDGILVDISRTWRKIEIDLPNQLVRLGPSVIGAEANRELKKHGFRIGPDPASIDAAMLGGMVANNASGMCCGVLENSYHTLQSMKFVLPNGLELDTSDPLSGHRLEKSAPEISQGLLKLKREIEKSPELVDLIRSKYRTKNTTGYSINAFLDYENPIDILAHLMVGSEGTLGFIAEVVLKILPDYPIKYTGLLLFNNIKEACDAVPPLRNSGARAIEFMDRASLRSVENESGISQLLFGLTEESSALLVEYQVSTEDELKIIKENAKVVLSTLHLLHPAEFSNDPQKQGNLWKIRKGLYPSIGGMRRKGTTVIIEDVAFAVEQLAEATLDLQSLFRKHNFNEGIIFGHAKDGNLHFVLTPSFNTEESIQQYSNFMDDVISLVTQKYNGALKAEHGTGRNIAPFVEAEWGKEAAKIMASLKELIDPQNILNPGVIINSDPEAHIHNLKPWPIIEEEVDKCIECGFCEPKCASRDLSLTPRRRIVVRREIKRLMQENSDPATLQSLIADYQYDGLDTCAIDGYCALTCPVHINTGELVKRLRSESVSQSALFVAGYISRHFLSIEKLLRIGLNLGHTAENVIGVGGIVAVTRVGEKIAGTSLPKWNRVIPRANTRTAKTVDKSNGGVVFFPSCIARVMGTSPIINDLTLPEVMVQICKRAGLEAWIPDDTPGNCCGMPFISKGYKNAFKETITRTLNKFWDWSEGGKLPIVIESSSCAYTLLTARPWLADRELEQYNQITILDPIEFIYSRIIPLLNIRQMDSSVALHPNCSAVKLGLSEKLEEIAKKCAKNVLIPVELKCCGFSGDRGLLYPELNLSASKPEAKEVNKNSLDGYYSSNLTCEMGMSISTGKPYRSIIYLVEEASR